MSQASAKKQGKWPEMMAKLCDDRYPAEAKAGLLQSVSAEDITGEMLASCARALMHRALPLDLKGIDVCGTGGDRGRDAVKTFNISTAVAFVVAAGGVSVVKHGNRAVSGVSGSSDVLAALHVAVCVNAAQAKAQHAKHGLCFVSAPAFHPALASLAPVRKALGRPTFLNLLGPLCNPAKLSRQVMGVYGFQPQVAEAARLLGRADAVILHAEDGLDEISLCDLTQVYRVRDGKIETSIVCPEDFGIASVAPMKIRGGTAEENAAIIRAVFAGEEGPPADIVCLNAAAAFMAAGAEPDMKAGLARARAVVAQGLARKKLEAMKSP